MDIFAWVFFLSLGVSSVLLVISYFNYKVYGQSPVDTIFDKDSEKVEDYLKAKEIFVRDPLSFKDKDKDGVDDIVDKNV